MFCLLVLVGLVFAYKTVVIFTSFVLFLFKKCDGLFFVHYSLEKEKDQGLKLPSVHLDSVKVSRSAPLLVAGRYAKLSRSLPQTPWFLDGERKLDSSVEELIAAPIIAAFGPNTTFAFISSGREDIDVRYTYVFFG